MKDTGINRIDASKSNLFSKPLCHKSGSIRDKNWKNNVYFQWKFTEIHCGYRRSNAWFAYK